MKKKQNNRQAGSDNVTSAAGLKSLASLEDRIRQRAYEVYQARGGTSGQDLDDWLQAEHELKAQTDKMPNPPDD